MRRFRIVAVVVLFVFATALAGWDGVSEDGIVMHTIGPATGDSHRLKVVSDTVMEGEMEGVFNGNTFSGDVRVIAQGPDQYTVSGTARPSEDETQYEMEMVYTRAKPTSDEQELRKLEAQLTQAFLKNDVTALDRLLADDLTYGTSDGMSVIKEMILDVITAGDYKAASLKFDMESIRVYGNAAVVAGRVTSEAVLMGADVSGQTLITNTWVRWKGRWQCVAMHASETEGI